jgi:hypothetical protein
MLFQLSIRSDVSQDLSRSILAVEEKPYSFRAELNNPYPGRVRRIVLVLCSSPPHSSPLRPIPAKVRISSNSWFSLAPVCLSRLEEGDENAYLNRGSCGQVCPSTI